MRLVAVVLPELGTGPDEPIVVSQWYARPGDEIGEGDRLVETLVGPAAVDVTAPATGRLVEVRAEEDDRTRPGNVLGFLAVPEESDGAARARGDQP